MTYTDTILNNPQTEPILGRTDMVENNAGGYVFKASDKELLNRFLLLGTAENTYYCGKDKLTKEFATEIIRMIEEDPIAVFIEVSFSISERKAMKPDAGIFVMALLATYGTPSVKKSVYETIHVFCHTGTHLFLFVDSVNKLRGWSRGLRNGVSKWYSTKSLDTLAYQVVKYRNRHGFTHRDVLRLAHPSIKTATQHHNDLYKYLVGKSNPFETGNTLIHTFETLQAATNAEGILEILKHYAGIQGPHISWEMIPTEFLNNKEVLSYLLPIMPVHALLRNLNRYSYNGMTVGMSDTVLEIVRKLTMSEINVHPMTIINTLITYKSGKGVKGNKVWDVNSHIVDALVSAYEISLNSVPKTDKRILVAVDVSGSMSSDVGGLEIEAYKIANTLAYTILRTNPLSDAIWFTSNILPCAIRRTSSLTEVLDMVSDGGGTDCSLAFEHALTTGHTYDAIIILTDSETWAGPVHGLKLLEEYKKKINKDVKVIEIAMVSNPYTGLPDDKNLLRIVGFDSNVPELVNKFVI